MFLFSDKQIKDINKSFRDFKRAFALQKLQECDARFKKLLKKV